MTMNEIRAKRLIISVEEILDECFNALAKLKADFIINAIQANQARKIYVKTIKKVAYYNHIKNSLTNKYPESAQGLHLRSIFDFEDFIKFFE